MVGLEAAFFLGVDFFFRGAAFFFGAARRLAAGLRRAGFRLEALRAGLRAMAFLPRLTLFFFFFARFFAKLSPPFNAVPGNMRSETCVTDRIIEHSPRQTASGNLPGSPHLTLEKRHDYHRRHVFLLLQGHRRLLLMRPFAPAGLASLAALLVIGQMACAGQCAGQAQRTTAILEKARKAHAGIYAPESFERGVRLAGEADRQCREEEERFFLFRSHGSSGKLHEAARGEARQALQEGKINEGMVRPEAMNARYTAIQSVEAAKGSLVRALKTRGDSAVADLTDSLRRLQEALAGLQARLDRGDYLSARDLGDRIVSESTRLQAAANRRTLAMPSLPVKPNRLY